MTDTHKQKIAELQKKYHTNPSTITSILAQFHELKGDFRENRADVVKEMQRNDQNPNKQ